MATLKKGSKGKPVEQLQTALNKNGASPKLKVDGIFGPKTDAGVKGFQKTKKLKVDGVVGEITAFVLDIGPRPEALTVYPITDTLKMRREFIARNQKVFSKFTAMFAQSASETDKLKQVLLKRQKMFEARQKEHLKQTESAVAKAAAEADKVMKEYNKTRDPAKIKELQKAMLKIDDDISNDKKRAEITDGANKTIGDLKLFQKGVAALKSKIEKE